MKSTRRKGYLAFRRQSGCSVILFSYCAGMTIIPEAMTIIFEVANLPKTFNGPQGIVASKTAASIEMLHGLEKSPVSLRIITI